TTRPTMHDHWDSIMTTLRSLESSRPRRAPAVFQTACIHASHRCALMIASVASFLWAAAGGEALGQVVQLPSYRGFGYAGSVWVPDGGTASLGGSGSAGMSSTSRGFGPMASRAVGAGVGTRSVSVTAQVIDLQA